MEVLSRWRRRLQWLSRRREGADGRGSHRKGGHPLRVLVGMEGLALLHLRLALLS